MSARAAVALLLMEVNVERYDLSGFIDQLSVDYGLI